MGIKQGIEQGIEQGSEKKELEMYRKMMDKGFEIKTIASIFSVSEESIKKLLMKAWLKWMHISYAFFTKYWGDVKVRRALDEMFEESTNKGIQMGIKQGIEQGIEQGVERGAKNTQIKIAIKMLVRNNQTLEEISEIVGLDLDALRELKKSI